MTIASLDVKGAYDGIRHEEIEIHVRKWRRKGLFSEEVMNYILFLFSQYRLGIVESKSESIIDHCLVNVGYC